LPSTTSPEVINSSFLISSFSTSDPSAALAATPYFDRVAKVRFFFISPNFSAFFSALFFAFQIRRA